MNAQLSESGKERAVQQYGFELYVYVDKSVALQDSTDLCSPFFLGRNGLIAVLKNEYSHLLDHHTVFFAYPEAGMTPKHQAAFMSMLMNHPLRKKWEKVEIITKSPYIISDTIKECVFILQEQPKMKLFNENPTALHEISLLEGIEPLKEKRMQQSNCIRTFPLSDKYDNSKEANSAFLNLMPKGVIKNRIVTIIAQDSNYTYFSCTNEDWEQDYWKMDIIDFWYYFNAIYFKFTKAVNDFLRALSDNMSIEQGIEQYLTQPSILA